MSSVKSNEISNIQAKSRSKIKRSRKGCHNCKRLKIKCDELKPSCSYCVRTETKCDYSIKLTWGGRPYKDISKRKGSVHPSKLPNSDFIQDKRIKFESEARDLTFVVEHSPSVDSNTSSFEAPPIKRSRTIGTVGSGYMDSGNFTMGDVVDPLMRKSMSEIQQPYISNSHLSQLNDQIGVNLHVNEDVNSIASESDKADSLLRQESINLTTEATPPSMEIKKSSDVLNLDLSSNKGSTKMNLPGNADLSDGIESLSNAIGKISNGKFSINTASSQILYNFVNKVENQNGILLESSKACSVGPPLSGNDSIKDPEAESVIDVRKSELDDKLTEHLVDSYTYDIMNIEEYLSDKPSIGSLTESHVSDKFGPRSFSYSSSFRSSKVDFENEEVSLDEEQSLLSHNSSKDSKSLITPNHLFDTVPYPLTPLPEMLLQVPFYRNLMHFYVNVVSQNLVPAPSYIYKDNPFKMILPQMAMAYPAILTTLLAFAASARSSLLGSEDTPKVVIDQLLARSCNELLKSLHDKNEATSDSTLATILLLSCYESCNGNSFERHRTHAHGAQQIIQARKISFVHPTINSESDSSPDSYINTSNNLKSVSHVGEGNIAYFLIRWFLYVEVIGTLSSTKDVNSYFTSSKGSYEPIDALDNFDDFEGTSFSNIDDFRTDIDYLLGFDVRFLKYFKEIISLIRLRKFYTSDVIEPTNTIPIPVIFRSLELKDNMTKAYERGEIKRQRKIEKLLKKERNKNNKKAVKIEEMIADLSILRSTNRMFFLMGILNLYRRALLIPRESPLVQNIANEIAMLVRDELAPCCSAEICTIFCSFCAGCETLEPCWRELFTERFSKLIEKGNINAKKGFQIMSRCWATGEDWITASNILDIDLALL